MRDSILNELALVTGSSVQTYSEPIIYDYIQRAFDHLFQKRFWDHLTSTTYHTLDGAAGVIVDTLVNVDDILDIQWIREYPYETVDTLKYFSTGLNHTSKIAYTGFNYLDTYYETKVFKILPITTTGDFAVRARRHPPVFEDASVIPFDALCIIHFVTASMLAIDGMNPGAEQRQNLFFDDRYETILSNEGDQVLSLNNPRYSGEFTVAL
jgi:hypothetical protein